MPKPPSNPTQVIALTGGIGSGKSRILQWLASQGLPTLNADQIARDIVAPGTEALNAIVQKFGQNMLQKDGTLNRAKLRQQIFQSPEAKTWLEQLLHPKIRQQTQKQIETLKKQQPALIIIEIPLLAETGKPDYIDQVWVADCQETTQCQRAAQRENTSPADIQKIIDQQASRSQRLALADYIINTEGSFEEVIEQLNQILLQLNFKKPHPVKNS